MMPSWRSFVGALAFALALPLATSTALATSEVEDTIVRRVHG
jgi:hypothetical protein